MANPWGGSRGIGSWAAEAEAEEREQAASVAAGTHNNNNNNSDLQSFPSLKEAVTTKKKKKAAPMSLNEFHTGGVSTRSEGLTTREMLQLPTGPKQRAPDDYTGGRIGGGFSNYGRSSGRREGDSDSNWGGRRSQAGYDDDRQGPPRRGSDYDLEPSRADESSDWGAGKRSMAPPSMDSGRTNRYDSLGAGSRADEADSWNLGKKPISPAPPARSNTFGSGYRNSGTDSDRWRRGDEDRGRDIPSSRTKLVLNAPTGEGAANESSQSAAKSSKSNPFGEARPREVLLAEKGLDWKKIDLEIEVKSAHSSRPSSAHSNRSESTGLVAEAVVKARPKVNPFGDAKPREVVLQEKGKDWRKMDLELEHRAIDRPETEEEKALKAEIENLKKDLEKEPPSDPSQEPGADQTGLGDLIQVKEKELEILTRELDDKVRFSQKVVERPGSGAGRFGSFQDRPPSRSGSIDDGRGVDFADRPRSRGTGDVWSRDSRPGGEDRRSSFYGSRDRGGYQGNRNNDRYIAATSTLWSIVFTISAPFYTYLTENFVSFISCLAFDRFEDSRYE